MWMKNKSVREKTFSLHCYLSHLVILHARKCYKNHKIQDKHCLRDQKQGFKHVGVFNGTTKKGLIFTLSFTPSDKEKVKAAIAPSGIDGS